MKFTDLQTLIKVIVKEQETIIGPIAIEQARRVSGLTITDDLSKISCTRDGVAILSDLVNQYEQLFGQASVEACRESVRQVLGQVDPKEVPSFLK